MDKTKKNACGCFSFLRKRVKKKTDRSLVIEDIQRREPEEAIFERGKELNSSVEHSLVTTQKLFSPGNFFRSTIMAPSCRTPQMHNLNRNNMIGFHDKAENTTARFILSQEAKFRDENQQSSLNSSVEIQRFGSFYREIKQKVLFVDEPAGKASENKIQDIEYSQKKPDNLSNENLNEGLQKVNQSKNIVKEDEKDNSSIKKESFLEKLTLKLNSDLNFNHPDKFLITAPRTCKANEFKGNEPVVSPSLELLDQSHMSHHFPLLEISPIKSIISMDDYSDIVNAFNHQPSKPIIPDLFIRNKIKPRPLPLLKPSTPRYLGKQQLLPKLRKDNQILLENLIFK
jgi:hypothetical protein